MGYWTATEKALFFRVLSAHSHLCLDLIAANIATKSTTAVTVYLSLLCDGDSSSGPTAIVRDLHPALHEVSVELIALKEKHTTHICAAEPARVQEAGCRMCGGGSRGEEWHACVPWGGGGAGGCI